MALKFDEEMARGEVRSKAQSSGARSEARTVQPRRASSEGSGLLRSLFEGFSGGSGKAPARRPPSSGCACNKGRR